MIIWKSQVWLCTGYNKNSTFNDLETQKIKGYFRKQSRHVKTKKVQLY